MKFQAITLERTACFGSCPIYSVTVHGDGTVDWNGIRYVKEKGQRTWSISQEKIEALKKAINKAKFTDLHDEYTSYGITCSPSTITTVKFKDGSGKKVDHYHGDRSAPSVLGWLERKIDEISGTERYIGQSWEREENEDIAF